MKVHLPSGAVVRVPADVAARATTLADFCPRQEEHMPAPNSRRWEARIHPPCGLAVIFVRKAPRR